MRSEKNEFLIAKKFSVFFLTLCLLLIEGCSTPSAIPTLSGKEKKMAEAFLNCLLFEEGGCYTLFGSKPITSMSICRGSSEDAWLEGLSSEALNTLEFVEDHTAANSSVWQKISESLKMDGFLFLEKPSAKDPTCSTLFFVNLNTLHTLFDENGNFFKERLSVNSWHELQSLLDNPDSSFWNSIFVDHMLTGLVHGYGKENVESFCKARSQHRKRKFSDSFTRNATKENFSIPVFVVAENEKSSKKYQIEREEIKNRYKDKDILQVTIEKLMGRKTPYL